MTSEPVKKTPNDLWNAAAPLIRQLEKHPFLVDMVHGKLDMESFQYYAIQDALYLRDFGDCLHMLSQNPGISIKDATLLEGFSKSVIAFEADMHTGFFRDWGIDATGVQQMPDTLLYTSYLKRVVSTRPHAEGLVALLPCYWVYFHVGKCMLKLRDNLGDSVKRNPAFDAWIDLYAGEAFEERVNEYIQLVDFACAEALPDVFDEMTKHFVIACRLEHMFWDQALALKKWPEFESN